MEQTSSLTESKPTSTGPVSAFRQAWQALMLQDEAYQPILEAEHPVRKGFKILLWVLLAAAIATTIGMAFNWLTLPRYNQIQEQIYAFLTNTTIYQDFAARSPLLATAFSVAYNLFWFIFRLNGQYPTQLMIVFSFFNVIISGILEWVTYAFVAQILAGWFGGKARKGVFWGSMALAFAPKLLLVLNVIPGMLIPAALSQAWLVATSYQAVRSTYQLSRGRSIAVILLTPILYLVFILLALLLSVIIGVVVVKLIS